MLESMHILQMNAIELKELVENELEQNPVLEEQPAMSPSMPIKSRNRNPEEDELQRDLLLTKPLTLQEHLLRQLRILATCQEDVDIGNEIIGNIDDDGYLKASPEEISQALGKDILKVEAMIAVVQNFEPIGVGARDLKECLLIQLEAKGKKGSLAWRVAENHLEKCGKKQYAVIAKALGVSPDQAHQAVCDISKLEPKPGAKYSDRDVSQYIIPDIFIRKIDDEYQVLSNNSDIPTLKISRDYQNMLEDKDTDDETKNYIKDKIKAANFVIKCVLQRQETMKKITEYLLREQAEFIEKGRAYLKPLSFRTIAEAIGRHESTISRAVNGKYVETPTGLYELREFFSAEAPGNGEANGNNSENSTTSVKMELKAIVDAENKSRPLSDEKIRKIFQDKGINMSRRVIAKYREELRILPSHLRKL